VRRWALGALALAGCSHPADSFPHPAVLDALQSVEGRKAAAGNVELHVEPADAQVQVDGVEVGQARDFDGAQGCLQLASGSHHLVVSRAGFQSADMTVFADDDGRQRVNLELTRSP